MSEQRYDFIHLVVSSLIVVVSLAWNTLVNDLIDYYSPKDKHNLSIKMIYTVLLTLVVGIIATQLSKIKTPIESFFARIISKYTTKLSQSLSETIKVK
jgi:hypothetical protein